MAAVWDRIKRTVQRDYLWLLIVALGIALRLRQYLANRSLSADETSLAYNIVDRSFFGLTQKLGFHQAAPLGFLFIEKLSILILGNRDYILRLFPLCCGLLAVFFVYRIARENFGAAGLFAVFLFAINSWLIFYSSELKQYSDDVMVTVLLIWLAARCMQSQTTTLQLLMLGLVGALTIWISHIAIFVLAGIGLTLAVERLLRKDFQSLARVLGAGALWLLSFGIDYMVALRYTASDPHYQASWEKSFMPLPPWTHLDWLTNMFYKFMLVNLDRTDQVLAYLFILLAIIGALSLLARQHGLAAIILFPFAVTLIASGAHLYPLTYRFMLFLIPLSLLLLAEALALFYRLLAPRFLKMAPVLSLIPAAALLWFPVPNTFSNFSNPQSISEIRPVVQYVVDHHQPDEKIYLYYGNVTGFLYYAPLDGFADTKSADVIQGPFRQDERKALERFYQDVQALRQGDKRNVWFIFSEIANCDNCVGDKRVFVTHYLDQYGRRIDSFESLESGAYLYQLNP